jgi:hypothetical protein
MDKVNVLVPNDIFSLPMQDVLTLKVQGEVKRYKGTLEDLNEVCALMPHDAFNLQIRRFIKLLLDDFKGTLEDLNASIILEPNNATALQH